LSQLKNLLKGFPNISLNFWGLIGASGRILDFVGIPDQLPECLNLRGILSQLLNVLKGLSYISLKACGLRGASKRILGQILNFGWIPDQLPDFSNLRGILSRISKVLECFSYLSLKI
jgi:hypothetical protein